MRWVVPDFPLDYASELLDVEEVVGDAAEGRHGRIWGRREVGRLGW